MPITSRKFRKRGQCCIRIIIMAQPEEPKSNMIPKRKGPSYTLSLARVTMVASIGVSVLISLTPKTLKKGMHTFSVPILQQVHYIVI